MADKEEGTDGRATLEEIFDAARSRSLTHAEYRLWSVVRWLDRGTGEGCYASSETLANILGLSMSYVEKMRADLASRGWLRVRRMGPKAAALYAVLSATELHSSERLELHSSARQGLELHSELHPSAIPPQTPLIGISTGSTLSSKFSDDVLSVFDYWQARRSELPNTKKAKPTDRRLSKVRARLRDGHTVEDLKLAVDGCLSNEFNVNGGYIDLELICRDDAHVTQYITKATNRKPDGVTYTAERAPRV